jgi:predicted PurR-regulated permease PerM
VSDRTFYARTFALLTLGLLAYLLYRIVELFLAPIGWAAFFAFMVYPAHRWLVRKWRGRASASAAVLTLVIVVVLLGPLAALGAAFAAQAAELLRYAQEFAVDKRPALAADLETLPLIGPAVMWLQDAFGVSLAQIQSWGVQVARTVLRWLAAMGQKAVLGALGTALGFVLMIFILFFAIRDGRAALDTLRALVPMSPQDRGRLFAHLASVTRAMVFGTGVTALVQGTLIAIGFAIVALPSPIVFGVLAALCALVPMVGTPVVWVPATIVLALDERWYATAFLLLWGGFVTTIDNVLRPILVAGRAEVATLTIFIGVLGGVTAFGPIGVVFGPLVLALIIALVRFTLEAREQEAGAKAP